MALTKTEQDILHLLSINSRMSYPRMSKMLNKSKQVIHYNINKLIKEGIIKNFVPIIDYTQLYSNWIRVLIKLSNASPKKEQEIIDFIKKKEDVKRIYQVDNYFDLVIEIATNNINNLHDLVLSLEEKYGKYILEDHFDIIVKRNYLSYSLFGGKKGSTEISWKNKQEKITLDEKDWKIIRELEGTFKVNYVTLASKLNTDPKTIIRRMKKMEQAQLIKGYGVRVDWRKIGKVHYKILLDPFIYDKKRFEELKKHLLDHVKVIKISEVMSRYMLEFDIVVDNYNDILELMHALKENFSDIIRSYDIVHIRNEIEMF